MKEKAIKYSAVIPVHNEAGNLTSLDKELKATLSALGQPFEIIYVNDGSTDGSLVELKSLKGVTIVNMNRVLRAGDGIARGFC